MTPPIDPGNKHFLVVVADESQAIAYTRASKSGPLQKRRTFDNPSARLKTSDILTDTGGRSFDSFGTGRHSMASEKTDPKRHIAEGFAKDIAEYIGSDVHSGKCWGYALVAAPQFLGLLRAELGSRTPEEPYAAVPKNVVGQSDTVIENLLAGA